MSPNTRQGQTSCYCRSNQRCHWPSAKSQRLSSRIQQHTFVAWWCGLAVLVTMESHVENRLTGPVQSCLQEFYNGLVNPKLDTDYPNQVCSCRVEIYAMSAIFGRLLRQQNLRPIRFPRGLIKPMTILGLCWGFYGRSGGTSDRCFSPISSGKLVKIWDPRRGYLLVWGSGLGGFSSCFVVALK